MNFCNSNKQTKSWVICFNVFMLFHCLIGCLWAAVDSREFVSRFLEADYGANTGKYFTPDEIDFIEGELAKLDALQVQPKTILGRCLGLDRVWMTGRDLIQSCNKALQVKGKRILIVPGGSTCFAYKKALDSYVIEVNINQLKTSRVGCILPGLVQPQSVKAYRIGSDSNPGYIVLGHELCHLLHCLDFLISLYYFDNFNINEIIKNYFSCDPSMFYQKGMEVFNSSLWAPPKRSSSENLWVKSEEQLTVIGVPFRGRQFSEFYLRLADGRLPRYAYQSADKHFFEDTEVVENIMNTLLGEEWKDVFDALAHRDCAAFDEELGINSPYNPWYDPSLDKTKESLDLSVLSRPQRGIPENVRARLLGPRTPVRTKPSDQGVSPEDYTPPERRDDGN